MLVGVEAPSTSAWKLELRALKTWRGAVAAEIWLSSAVMLSVRFFLCND